MEHPMRRKRVTQVECTECEWWSLDLERKAPQECPECGSPVVISAYEAAITLGERRWEEEREN
jgi:hypothetical protein